jgi:hypothetical protein
MADIIDWLDGSGHRLPTGEPNASGLLRVLDPGTQVEVPIFDAEGETISQPVELDAAGKAAVYVEGPVDLSFEDSTGASVDTMSGGNIHGATALLVGNAGFTGALASGSQGAGGRTYLDSVLSRLFATFGGVDGKVQESASAVPRLLVELLAGIQLSVKDFGAVGDGLSDDTTYIQLALNRCAARGGGRVYIDPGTYLISSAITIAANVSLVGAGSASSIIKLSNATANAVVVSAGGVGNNTLQGFQVTHSSSSSGTGVLCSATDHIVIRDVQVAPLTFANGVKIDACNNTAIYDSFLACTSAAPSRCLTYTTSGENHFVTNTEFRAALGACVEMNTSAS